VLDLSTVQEVILNQTRPWKNLDYSQTIPHSNLRCEKLFPFFSTPEFDLLGRVEWNLRITKKRGPWRDWNQPRWSGRFQINCNRVLLYPENNRKILFIKNMNYVGTCPRPSQRRPSRTWLHNTIKSFQRGSFENVSLYLSIAFHFELNVNKIQGLISTVTRKAIRKRLMKRLVWFSSQWMTFRVGIFQKNCCPDSLVIVLEVSGFSRCTSNLRGVEIFFLNIWHTTSEFWHFITFLLLFIK